MALHNEVSALQKSMQQMQTKEFERFVGSHLEIRNKVVIFNQIDWEITELTVNTFSMQL